MKPDELAEGVATAEQAGDLLAPLLESPIAGRGSSLPALPAGAAVVIGELVALADDGASPWVGYPGQPGPRPLCARTAVDLHARHVGAQVVLAFEQGDPARPVVIGLLREPARDAGEPAAVQIDADGRRVEIVARERLVLRCGQASITLTRAGKVLIEGSYVLSRATGANQIKGGSIQLN
jgi:hypothetical protein